MTGTPVSVAQFGINPLSLDGQVITIKELAPGHLRIWNGRKIETELRRQGYKQLTRTTFTQETAVGDTPGSVSEWIKEG